MMNSGLLTFHRTIVVIVISRDLIRSPFCEFFLSQALESDPLSKCWSSCGSRVPGSSILTILPRIVSQQVLSISLFVTLSLPLIIS